jgi:phenylalanyl-tRNA synthetase alpha chain
VLVRFVLRVLDYTLTHGECNALRDEVYAVLHRGGVWQWVVCGWEV